MDSAEKTTSALAEKDDQIEVVEKRREISRFEACRRIGCSTMQCVRWEQEGAIRVRRDVTDLSAPIKSRPRVWLDAEDVEKIAKKWIPRRGPRRDRVDTDLVASNARGRLAALCFPLFEEFCRVGVFDQRAVFSDIVRRTEGDPFLVSQLYEQWKLGLEGTVASRRRREIEARERELQKQHDAKQRLAESRQHHREQSRDMKEAARMRLEAERLAAEGRKRAG